jgi:hypothetical protein
VVFIGEQLCDAILKVQSSTSIITTLIDLLTIEARSFSSQTIKTIKIVEMSTGPVLLPSYHQPPINFQPVVVMSTNQPTQQQQYLKPLTVIGINPSANLLSLVTSSIIPNDKKRKHDSISETIAAVVNGISSPPKRPCPVPSSKPTTDIENDTIRSTMSDLLDRCSSSPFDNEIRLCLNDLCQRVVFIVDQSLTGIYNQLPSPVFKRKMETPTSKIVQNIDEQSLKKKKN